MFILRCCLVISNFKLMLVFLHGCRYAVQQLHRPIILQLQEVKGERLCKKQQMELIFYLLDRGLPMLEYEASKELLRFLGVPKLPLRHWSDNSVWDMATYMHLEVMAAKREMLQGAWYFSVSCDEITTMDNGTWVSIHVYVIKGYERFPMLAALEHVQEGATSNNLTKVVMTNLQALSGFDREEIAARLVCFGAGNHLLKYSFVLSCMIELVPIFEC
jgi:hypothetical protein